MADVVTVIALIYHMYLYIRSINPFKRDAIFLVIHNFCLYYIINRFKNMAQNSIHYSGPENTFYYVPFVYETPSEHQSAADLHIVLKTKTWTFFETLFRHHIALLLPFILGLLVPRCKLDYISSLVIMSNLTMCVCFMYAMWQWLNLSGLSISLQLLPIFLLGPVVQSLLMFRFTSRVLLNLRLVN